MAKRAAKAKPAALTGAERLVVLHGDDPFLQREHLHTLRDAIESNGHDVDTLRLDGDRAEPADVFDELRSFGLMQQYKLVVVESADKFVTNHRENLERYADDPVDIATLVLRVTKWNKSWRIHKAIEKIGAVVTCDGVSESVAERWVVARAKTHHAAAIKPAAAQHLVARLGPDLGRLDSELAKLAVAAPENTPIDIPDVEALVGRSSEKDAWDIQDALLSGDPNRAITKLSELIDLAGHHEQFMAHWFADLTRKLATAAAMLDTNAPEFEICKTLRIWPKDRQRPFIQAARKLGPRGAARALARITDLDARAKSGYASARRNLETFALQFTAAVR